MFALGRACEWDEFHAVQVAFLAQMLYEGLFSNRHDRDMEREWLEYGALLHDIGYIIGENKHHKHAERMIREAELPTLLEYEKRRLAAIARGHRKQFPERISAVFCGMTDSDYECSRRLTALVRVADALDRTHRSMIRRIGVREYERECEIDVKAAGEVDAELSIARRKCDLLASVLMKSIVFRVIPRDGSLEREGDDGPTS